MRQATPGKLKMAGGSMSSKDPKFFDGITRVMSVARKDAGMFWTSMMIARRYIWIICCIECEIICISSQVPPSCGPVSWMLP